MMMGCASCVAHLEYAANTNGGWENITVFRISWRTWKGDRQVASRFRGIPSTDISPYILFPTFIMEGIKHPLKITRKGNAD